MSLPNIVLDDLDWQGMVDAVRTQIAAASAEEWTLHAPVDPGVTLIELFAYALEQRVYWLDQVTDPLILAMLALLGEKPRPARAARTLVEFYADTDAAVVVAPRTELQRNDNDSIIHFHTLFGVTVLPTERIEISSQYGARVYTPDASNRWYAPALTLLPADSGPAEFRCDFWIRGGLAATDTRLNVLFEIDAPAVVAPHWTHDAVNQVQPPAALRWRYYNGATRVALPRDRVRDATQGLRRAGIVEFDVPGDWSAGGPPENGLTRYSLWGVVDSATFSAPPFVQRTVPNVAIAAHQRARSLSKPEIDAQLDSWLPLPNLRLQLTDLLAPLEASLELQIRERDGVSYDWSATTDLGRHGPGDRVFAVNRSTRQLEFGDGLTARIPVPDTNGATPLHVAYLGGGGEAGNVGANLTWQVPAYADLLANNPVAAAGGREPETAAAARDRAAGELERRQRAVTAADFEALALDTPGIALARAHAAVGYHPDFPCSVVPGAVTVFIVPDVPRLVSTRPEWRVDYPQPDPGAVAEVLQRLSECRLVTTEVFVRGPTYRRVGVHVVLAGEEIAGQGLRDRIADRLKHFFDPLTGGEADTGWPFGHPVRPSEVAHVVDGIANRSAQVSALALVLDGDGPSSDCEDLPIGAHELVCLDDLAVEWRGTAPRRGGLR